MFIDYDIVYQIDLLSWKKKISRFEVKYGFYLSDSSISALQKRLFISRRLTFTIQKYILTLKQDVLHAI